MNYSIELKNITKQYDGKIVLDKINLRFDTCHTYYIIGDNGSGKSTLLNIISGYDTDYSGEYVNNGLSIGYLLQEDLLFRNLTVKDNLFLQIKALSSQNIDVESIIEALNLRIVLNKKVSQLSGGEKKRVAIAQIILKNTDIILLDEPMANIHQSDIEGLLKTIYDVFQNKIIIIVSHGNVIENINQPVKKIILSKGKVINDV
ncbi:TPA: ATP-binding cassette domain-containing protein [Streptococcus suis]|nr:ATP-binding cassette domain-containing protein [Streptococcus suis]